MSRTSILSLLLAIGLAAGACSGGAADSGVASLDTEAEDTKTQHTETHNTEAESIPGEEAVLVFTACLRDEGLDVDDPAIDGVGNLVAPSPHALAAKHWT